jgi:hypothetical protein
VSAGLWRLLLPVPIPVGLGVLPGAFPLLNAPAGRTPPPHPPINGRKPIDPCELSAAIAGQSL